MKNYTISRPVNGISLNGDEHVLNDSGKVMQFDTEKKAKAFMVENGITDEETYTINEE